MAKHALQIQKQRLVLFITALLSSCLSINGLAQTTLTEQDQSNAEKSIQAAPIEKQALPQKKADTITPTQEGQDKSNKRFTPSESISEDLSVAFPVDI